MPQTDPFDGSVKDSLFPMIIGGDVKVFLSGGEGGYIYFWRDREQLENNCGGFLRGHGSNVSRILMTKSQDMFYSVGENDCTLIEWKIEFINDITDFSKPSGQVETGDKGPSQQKGMNQQGSAFVMNNQDFSYSVDETFKREKDYCFFINNISDKFKDNFILFRATNQKLLNGLLQEIIPPFHKKQYVEKRAP
jgi:hypothetical protein